MDRPIRIRLPPLRYLESKDDKRASKKRKYACPALQAQYEANQATKKQLKINEQSIEDTAEYFSCALTALKPKAVRVTANGKTHAPKIRCPLMGAQPKKLAVADDGYYYDFEHITQYIRDNTHNQLRSPRTGEPMGGQVYYVGKCKTKNKPKTLVWTREIFVREELSEDDSDDDKAGPSTAAPAESVVVD